MGNSTLSCISINKQNNLYRVLILDALLSKAEQLELTQDEAEGVRAFLAKRGSDLHPSIQRILATDVNAKVRFELAKQMGLSKPVQRLLALDQDDRVRFTLALGG